MRLADLSPPRLAGPCAESTACELPRRRHPEEPAAPPAAFESAMVRAGGSAARRAFDPWNQWLEADVRWASGSKTWSRRT